MSQVEIPEPLQDELRAAWQHYLDLLAPFRPDLHRYCRRLTRDLWDAEDLVQDTLIRAFAALGKHHPAVERPRAYLLRTATHCWIDTLRRRGSEARALAMSRPEPARDAPGAVRDAGTVLMQQLSPQERAAVVLKDVFELDLAETAEVLQTTVGAVKAALHRGRTRLRESDQDPGARPRPLPPAELVDRFVAAYNAKDLGDLTALLLDHASVEQLGCAYSTGIEALEEGFLDKAVNGHPEWPEAFQYESARLERARLDGEPIALGLVVRRGREALEQVMRFEPEEGRIARIRAYAFCPEVMREIGERLGVPVRTGLYRYPTPAPGGSY
jgi:RNA polymerase sigma-70 factor (ECF subfamily)